MTLKEDARDAGHRVLEGSGWMSRRRGKRVEVVELDPSSRHALAGRVPGLSGYGTAVLVAVTPEARQGVLDALRQVADAANDGERVRLDRIIDALCPEVDVPSARLVQQAREEAVLRVRILRDFGALSAQDLAAVSGSSADNRSQAAYRWRRDGRIFAVPYRGTLLYLAFQFDDDGRPRPVISRVLAHLGDRPPWEVATWFVVPHGMLDRRPPVDLLATDPDLVEAAAARDALVATNGPRSGRSVEA